LNIKKGLEASISYRELRIGRKEAGRRLDVLLTKRFSRFSRTQIARFIAEGNIIVVDRRIKASSIVNMGDVVRIEVPDLVPTEPPPPLPDIIFEDERVLLVNKPAGLLVHPVGDVFVWGLIGLFKSAYPEHRIDLAHRLDRETSGALLLTKDKEANAFLKKAIQNREVKKLYKAIVCGVPEWDELELQAPTGLLPGAQLRLRRGVVEGGQYSHTTFRVLQRLKEYALIECELHTGRTHQIRVHLEHLGFPILGDKIYGHPDSLYISYLERGETPELRELCKISRQALHAYFVHFPHPNGGARNITVPMPLAFQQILDGEEPSWELTPCLQT
jgi:RluA family pseudouridine synthase